MLPLPLLLLLLLSPGHLARNLLLLVADDLGLEVSINVRSTAGGYL